VRELVQDPADAPSIVVADVDVLGVRILGSEEKVLLELFEVMRVRGLPAARTELVETHVRGDPGDPSAQLVATIEPRERLINPKERVLSGLRGVLARSQHASAHPLDPALVTLVDGLVGAVLSALERLRERAILARAGRYPLDGRVSCDGGWGHELSLLKPAAAAGPSSSFAATARRSE
jgi:hypothetical protein